MSDPALSFDDVSKRYGDSGVGARTALAAVSFDVRAGETIAIVGRSGSGKSTLLHLAAGIDLPSSGHVRAFGRDLAGMTERERTRFRRDDVGLVFQFFHLMPHLSVRENVALPALIAKSKPAVFEPRVRDLLERVSLADRAEDSVQELSGGEMQRVAICRALVRHPSLLLADEPTGNLDDLTGRSVMDLMLQLVSDEGATLVFVTHSAEMAGRADTVWSLHSGRLARA
ncbi:MAG: ABC transporter ATP-binding protein [Gemmatimonadales bacterium]|nr:MAG: ABC transporter ATP-binding protein [Gemmatimonadales bacterium]